MKRELLLPKLGLTMTEGVMVEWLVQPGQAFEADQALFVVESEKAANEIPAEAAGTLLAIVADAGATLPCGAVIGYWDGTRVPVTPLALRLAAQRGLDLRGVVGSGPRGRIRVRDLPEADSSVSANAPTKMGGRDAILDTPLLDELRAPTAMEATIAKRLTAAKQVPHFYLAVEAEVSALMDLRAQLNAAQSAQKFTLNHFVLAAVGRALAQMPQLNRVWTEAGIQTFAHSDVGMAVNTERGLLVPVLRSVGAKAVGDIARESREAIGKAQAGRLSAAEMAGGAITVSNAGMHQVSYMTSIINPGQAMILGVGSIREVFRPSKKGKPKLRREMGMVLSADHRVLDGVSALALLKHITDALENPLSLLVAP